MSIPDSPVADDIETDPSSDEEEEEEVEEEVEEEEDDEEEEEVEEEEVEEEEVEEEIEEEVEEEEVEEEGVDEEEVEEEEVEEEEEEEEVEEIELEVEEEEEDDGEQGEEQQVEEEVEEEEEEEDEEEEQEEQQQEAVEEKREEQQQQQQVEAAVEEKKEEQQQQQQQQAKEAVEEKEEQNQQQQEAMEEDKTAVPGSALDAVKDIRDLSQHMEFEGQDKNLGPSSMLCMEENDAMLKNSEILTLKKEELPLKYEILSNPKSREDLSSVKDCTSQGLDIEVEKAESLLQKKTFGGYNVPGCNSKGILCGDNNIDSGARVTKSSSDTVQDIVIGSLPRDCVVEDSNGGQNSRNKMMLSEMESRDDVKHVTSRTRSLSPSAEIKGGNKRPRIICDFFAKGWCIRGSSCSFLHIKDTRDNTDQEAEADLVTTHQKRESKVEEGVRGNVERSRMNEQEATPSWHPSQEKQKFPPRDNLFPENRFTFSASDNYFTPNLSLNSTRADGVATLRNQRMYKGYTSTLSSHSPNSSLVTQFPASSMSLSHRILGQSGRSLPFSSSLGASNVDSQKFLNTDEEYLTSKSTFSGFSLVSSSRVPSYPAGYKSKICSYDWEPSVPFQPSFFITSMNVSSTGDLYDPLRDSIEIPNIGDGSLKASLLIHGSNVQASSQVQTYGDSALVGKHMSDLNDDKSSVSSHNKFCDNEPNKNCVLHETDCLPPETEITSGTYVNYQGKMGTGQHAFGVADSTKKERDLTECDARRHGEGSGHKKKRVDRDKKNHEMDVDFQMDGSMQKESKALKIFRAALVDHVKELLKPAWHDGRLSKDAHIMIVKKSVDKVVSTLEPHQISTIDTAKQYVSSSQVKIAKLVNGYVNKYGKS